MIAKINIGILVGVLVFLISTALCQSPTGPEPPAAEIRSLSDALSGQWLLNVKWEPDSDAPNGLTNTGEETWRHGPGGYTLVEEEHLRFPKKDVHFCSASSGGTEQRNRFTGWNAKTCSFHM